MPANSQFFPPSKGGQDTRGKNPRCQHLFVWVQTIAVLIGVAGLGLFLGGWASLAGANPNLLSNPGFEAGAEGWAFSPSTAQFEIVSQPTHEGNGAASLTKPSAGGAAFIYQDVSVVAGQSYQASVWAVWDSASLTNVKLRIDWLNPDGDRVHLDEVALETQSSAYQLLRLENVVAPDGATMARVEGYTFVGQGGSAQPAFFDDFFFGLVGDVVVTPSSTAVTTMTPGTPIPTATPTATSTPVSPGAVVINEVFYDPATPGGEPAEEWVELYNRSGFPVSLAGWTIADHVGEDDLAAVTIPPAGFVIIAASEAFSLQYPEVNVPIIVLDGQIGKGLNNGGDAVWLRDREGTAIDAMSYGDNETVLSPAVPLAPEGASLERIPAGRDSDTAADWFPQEQPSPGTGVGVTRQYLPLVRTSGE